MRCRGRRSLLGDLGDPVAIGHGSAREESLAPELARMMRRRTLQTGLAVGLAASACSVAPFAVASGRPGQQLQLVLPLKVDASGLSRLALAVSTPSSRQYRHYETVSQIAHRFGASPATRRRVIAWLRAHGARDARVDATGLLAEATIDVGVAEKLFSVRLMTARAAGGAAFLTPASEVRVPRALAGVVQGVYGLDTRPAVQSTAEITRGPEATGAAGQPSSEEPRTGTPAGCAGAIATGGFTPNQYVSAYDFGPLYNAGFGGQGQRVALIEADGVKTSDVAAFDRCGGLAHIPAIHQYRVGIARTPPPGAEATLDTEILAAAAPDLGEIDVYETNPDIGGILTALTAPLQRPRLRPQVISVSFGTCERAAYAALGRAGLVASEFALQAAALSGVTVVAASGDTGSAGCQHSAGPPDHRLAVLYPASSTWVTAVGGTNLALTSGNQIADEIVWNDAKLHLGAGGGGLSALWGRPGVQNGVVAANSRAVPDVSMLADVKPGYAIYCTTPDCSRESHSGPWLTAGGTSAAAPLFAGGLALIDQDLRTQGQEYLGYLDPLLYSVGESRQGYLLFNDVTRIGNDTGPFIPGWQRPLGCCAAHVGYDEASGWGSVDMAQLASFAVLLQSPSLGDVTATVPPHQRPVANNGLVVRVRCSRACYAVVDAAIEPGKSPIIEAYSSGFHLDHAGSKLVRLSFTPAQRAKLRAALARHTKITGDAYGVLTTAQYRFEKYSPAAAFTITS